MFFQRMHLTSVLKQIFRYRPAILYLLLVMMVALTNNSSYQYLIIAISMLVLPLFDNNWRLPTGKLNRVSVFTWLLASLIIIIILLLEQNVLNMFLITTVFIAIPEEWFFRAYLMKRAGDGIKANIIASMAFSAIHILSSNWIHSLLVFFPSLLFGWVYQKTKDIFVVIILHVVSNIVYIVYLKKYIEELYQ